MSRNGKRNESQTESELRDAAGAYRARPTRNRLTAEQPSVHAGSARRRGGPVQSLPCRRQNGDPVIQLAPDLVARPTGPVSLCTLPG